MIKFFRHIRKKLLSENNFSKYLLYAIGEIILVVIGILIALAINNRNEIKKTALEEQLLLKDLKIDFQLNLEQLIEKRDYLLVLQDKTKILSEEYLNKELSDSMVMKADTLVGYLQSRATFDPNQGIINELISSGKLRSFKNRKLRNYLSSWSGNLQDIKEAENRLLLISHQLREYLNANYSFADLFEASYVPKYPEGKTNFPSKKQNIFNDIAFENYLSRLSRSRSILIYRLEAFEDNLQEALQVLDEEIE